MALSTRRRNEIAWQFLCFKITELDLYRTDFNSPQTRQQIRATAEAIGIKFEEAMEFVAEILRETSQ